MNDCPNAGVRDLLPDLLHGRLHPATRAMVETHLSGCADCRAELALLGDLHGTLRRTPALDLAAISAALPSYRAPVRRSWVGWRTAAAIALVAAGGSSLLVMQRNIRPLPDSPVVAVAPVPRAPAMPKVSTQGPTTGTPSTPVDHTSRGPTTARVPVATPVESQTRTTPAGGRELAVGGGSLTDLSDRELTSLLKEIESLDAVPSTEVESASVSPISPRRATP